MQHPLSDNNEELNAYFVDFKDGYVMSYKVTKNYIKKNEQEIYVQRISVQFLLIENF